MRKYEVAINNKQYSVVVKKYTGQDAEMEINGKTYHVKLDAPIVSDQVGAPQAQQVPVQPVQPVQAPQPVQPVAAPQPQVQQPVQPAPQPTAAPVSAGAEMIKAPIPGSILDILVKVGDTVSENQTVFKMEAMKMENDINTTTSGTVKAINVAVGDAVNQGQDLMIIE